MPRFLGLKCTVFRRCFSNLYVKKPPQIYFCTIMMMSNAMGYVVRVRHCYSADDLEIGVPITYVAEYGHCMIEQLIISQYLSMFEYREFCELCLLILRLNYQRSGTCSCVYWSTWWFFFSWCTAVYHCINVPQLRNSLNWSLCLE